MAWVYARVSDALNTPWTPGLGGSPVVSEKPTLPASWWEQRASLCGMSWNHSRGKISKETSTSLRRVSLARIAVLRDCRRAWQESAAYWSLKSLKAVCAWDQNLSSWKTFQGPLLSWGGLYAKPLPRQGMMLGGVVYECPWPVRSVRAKGGSFWRRPCARDWKGYTTREGKSICNQLKALYPHTSGKPNPRWIEWLQGCPGGLTELKPWVMQWYQNKRSKRSKSSQDSTMTNPKPLPSEPWK